MDFDKFADDYNRAISEGISRMEQERRLIGKLVQDTWETLGTIVNKLRDQNVIETAGESCHLLEIKSVYQKRALELQKKMEATSEMRRTLENKKSGLSSRVAELKKELEEITNENGQIKVQELPGLLEPLKVTESV